jgi:hypothetical protein
MELEKFEQAKKIKEDLDRLERQKSKIESALQSCSLNVTIGYYPSKAFISRKDEVSIYNTEVIREMVSKELERLIGEIELVKEKFEKI